MFKKLFAAAICGIVIASIASHADAAGPASFARGFAAMEHVAIASIPSQSDAETVAVAREQTMSALDSWFNSFDQSRND